MPQIIKNMSRRGLTPRSMARFFMLTSVFALFLSGIFSYTRLGVDTPERAYAATSSNLNYQARLLSSSGNIVPDGYYNLEFKLYSAASGGTALWTERYHDTNGVTAGGDNRVRVVNGYLSVNLASITAFPAINWDQDMWLTMNVGGTAQTATPTFDGEMSPRIKLTAVPYAFQAQRAEQLTKTIGSYLGTLQFPGSLAGNTTYNLVDPGAMFPSVDICLSSGNCAGSGGGLVGSGTAGRLAVFGSSNSLGSSYFLQGPNSITIDPDKSLMVDTDTFVVDAANNRIGIGTTTPAYKLDVISADAISAKFSGRVIAADAVNNDELVTLAQLNSAVGGSGSILQGGNTFGANMVIGTNDAYSFSVKTNNTTRFSIDNAGAATFNATLTVGSTLYAGGAGLSITNANGGISKTYDTSGTVNQNDVVVMVNSSGVKVATSTTPRDVRVMGVYRGASGSASGSVAIAANTTVNATAAAVSIGDQLVVSDEAGRVMVDNSATSGVLGYATTAKAAGSVGLIGARLSIVNGTSTPYYRVSDLRIQNAAGTTDLLRVDATNSRIAIGPGAVAANGILTVGTNTTDAANGVWFGTDTNLYRSGNAYLRTNGSLQLSGSRLNLLNNAGQVTFGSASDTNLYRGGANLLQTDSALNAVGALTQNGVQVCLISGNCAGTGGNGDILQGGNSFGVPMVIGTNNAQTLSFETNGNTVATFTTGGQLQLATTGSNGGLLFGGDATANLYRSTTGVLTTDAVLQASRFKLLTDTGNFDARGADNAGRARYISGVTGDTNSLGRFYISANGSINWGNGTDAPDVNFYRSTVGTVRTNGSLLTDGKLAVGVTTTPSSKLLVNDSAGAQAGFANTAIMGISSTATSASNALVLHNGTSPLLQVRGDGFTSIGAGAAPANGILTVGTNTGTAAGGIYFGTDTSLYRAAGNQLATGGIFSAQSYVSSSGVYTAHNNTATAVEFRSGYRDTAGNSATASFRSGNNVSTGNTGQVNLQSGNATSGNSGNIVIDAGTASGTTGTISLGATNASALTIGRTGAAITIQGATTLNNTLTVNSGTGLVATFSGSVQGADAVANNQFITLGQANNLYSPGSGSGNYIQNGTALQTANFNIRSTDVTSTTAFIQGAAGQTGDLLRIRDADAENEFRVIANGTLRVSSGVGSRTLISARNTGDINDRLGVSASGVLRFGDGNNATDTTLYRSAASKLETAGALNVVGALTQNGNDVCTVAGNCTGMGGGGDILQGGNSFGAPMTIGTNDNYALNFETNGSVVATFTTGGQLQLPTQGATGGLLIGGDATLFRSAANTLRTDGGLGVFGQLTAAGLLNSTGSITAQRTNATDRALDVKLIADTGPRLRITANGSIAFGDGSGTLDTNLYRQGANILATDDSFQLLGTGSNLTVQGTGTSTFAGSVTSSGTVSATSFTGSGANLTDLNASSILTGTLADARLSSNVALLNRNSQIFAGNDQTFKNSTNSTTAFNIQNAAGNAFFNADSTNQRITIGGGAGSNARLHVAGEFVDANTWTARTAAEANGWQSIAYGKGTFVAVSYNGTNRVMTSPDGITWTARTVPGDEWQGITYGNGLFVAVAVFGGTNRVMTSPDGITWTARTAAEANGWRSIVYGNGKFVAVAQDGTNRVMTSPDGITWTARTAAEANGWTSVTYGNGLFVAISYDGTNQVMTSPDGITWTSRSASAVSAWSSVTYGNGLFVATTTQNGANYVMTSPDGITWTSRTVPTYRWASVTYGNGLFVAVSSNANQVMTSPDGITWASNIVGTSGWASVTYGNGLFVAVGANRVMTSNGGYGTALRTQGDIDVIGTIKVNGYEVCTTLQNCGGGGSATGDILQNGNAFGSDMTIGTNDNYALNLETNGTTRLTISNTGSATFTGAVTATGFTGSGAALSNLNASNVASGVLGDGFLSTNVALLNRNSQIVTGNSQVYRNTTNGTAAFQIQNSSNANVLNADTTNRRVTIGAAAAPTLSGAQLVVTVAEVQTTLRIGNATNGVDIDATGMTYSGTARKTKKIVLAPEYIGAVLDGTGTGTMTAGHDITRRENYYKWSTTSGSMQQYDIVITTAVPSDWSAWAPSNALSLNTYSSGAADAGADVSVIGTAGVTDVNLGAATPASGWGTYTFNLTDVRYTADGMMTIRIRMSAQNSGVAQLGNITLTYLSRY